MYRVSIAVSGFDEENKRVFSVSDEHAAWSALTGAYQALRLEGWEHVNTQSGECTLVKNNRVIIIKFKEE